MLKVYKAVDLFVSNHTGWILAIWNLLTFAFYTKFRNNGLHNPAIFGCVEGKIESIKIYNPHFGLFSELVDLGFLLILFLNAPAMFISDVVSDALFSSYPRCFVSEPDGWIYSWYYIARIFMTINLHYLSVAFDRIYREKNYSG